MNRTTIRQRALGALGALAALTLTLAAPAPALAVDSTQNAALRYWQAWALLSETSTATLGEVKRQDLASPDFTLSEELTAIVEPTEGSPRTSAQVVELVMLATTYPESDFGIQYELGPGTLLTHLTPMRRSSTMLLVDARRLFDAGNADAAVDRLVASYKLANHAIDDKTTISTLVAQILFQSTQGVTDYALEAGLLTPAHQAKLAEALNVFDASDPFEFKAVVRGEREIMGGWMRAELEKGAEALVKTINDMTSIDPDAPMNARLQALLDSPDVEATIETHLGVYDAMMESVEKAWGDADAIRALDQKLERMCGNNQAALACLFMPAMSKLHERYLESIDLVASAKERLTP